MEKRNTQEVATDETGNAWRERVTESTREKTQKDRQGGTTQQKTVTGASSVRSSRISKPEEINKYGDNHAGITLGYVITSYRGCRKAPGKPKPGEIHRNKTQNESIDDHCFGDYSEGCTGI